MRPVKRDGQYGVMDDGEFVPMKGRKACQVAKEAEPAPKAKKPAPKAKE